MYDLRLNFRIILLEMSSKYGVIQVLPTYLPTTSNKDANEKRLTKIDIYLSNVEVWKIFILEENIAGKVSWDPWNLLEFGQSTVFHQTIGWI